MADRLDHPQTHDVFQETVTVIISAFVGKVCLLALFIADCLFQFCTKERPGAGTDIGKFRSFARNSQNGRCRVMRGNHNHITVKPDCCFHLLRKPAENSTGLLKRSKDSFRQTKQFNKIIIPVFCCGTDKLTCAGNGIFRCPFSRQKIIEVIGNKKQRICLLELLRCFFL